MSAGRNRTTTQALIRPICAYEPDQDGDARRLASALAAARVYPACRTPGGQMMSRSARLRMAGREPHGPTRRRLHSPHRENRPRGAG